MRDRAAAREIDGRGGAAANTRTANATAPRAPGANSASERTTEETKSVIKDREAAQNPSRARGETLEGPLGANLADAVFAAAKDATIGGVRVPLASIANTAAPQGISQMSKAVGLAALTEV